MRVSAVTKTPDSYRQTQYYAGEHLAYYYDPTAPENRARVVSHFKDGVFIRQLEKASGQRDLLSVAPSESKQINEQYIEQASSKELMQRLDFINGIHYSTAHHFLL